MPLKLRHSQLHVHAQVHLSGNGLRDEGWCAIFDALRDSPQNKIAKWNLYDEGVVPTVAKSLAAYMAVSASLTEVRVSLPCPFPSHAQFACVCCCTARSSV